MTGDTDDAVTNTLPLVPFSFFVLKGEREREEEETEGDDNDNDVEDDDGGESDQKYGLICFFFTMHRRSTLIGKLKNSTTASSLGKGHTPLFFSVKISVFSHNLAGQKSPGPL